MLDLEGIVAGGRIRGVAGSSVIEVVRVEWIGSDAVNVVYRGTDGPAEVLLFRDAEPRLELVQATRAFSFDGDGEAFRIASEAQRIRPEPAGPEAGRLAPEPGRGRVEGDLQVDAFGQGYLKASGLTGEPTPRDTYDATSPSGRGRGANRGPVGTRGVIRSTR